MKCSSAFQWIVKSLLYKIESPKVINRSISPPYTKPPPATSLRQVAAHVTADSGVVEQALNGTDGTDGNFLVPKLLLSKRHDVLLGDAVNDLLDILGGQAASGGDDLAADILSNGGGAVEGEQDGGLQLGLGTLNLSGGDAEGESGPFTEGEVDKVIESSQVLRNEVDTPETKFKCQ